MDTRTAGRKGGRAKSLRKTEACRLNGLRNKAAAGRPPTKGWHLVSRGYRWAILEASGAWRVLAITEGGKTELLYQLESGSSSWSIDELRKLSDGKTPPGYHRLRWGDKMKAILHAVAWA